MPSNSPAVLLALSPTGRYNRGREVGGLDLPSEDPEFK